MEPGFPESASELAALVRSRRLSPVEVVERALARIEGSQPATNAFTQVFADRALADARRLEGEIAPGHDPGPLAGVPVAVKDLFDVAGAETTGCCAAYRGNVAATDSAVVARLRAAGAVVVAKTNQHELACGATNLVSACGPTANPWDGSRMTGGSSGGSGAAVAARAVPLAMGTDTGGSIRIPASFCGIFGLKPTHGAVPLDGVMPLAPSLDCPGPMAATAADLELAWNVLSGESGGVGGEIHSAAVVGGYFADRIDPEVLEAVDVVARTLERAGFSVGRADGDGIDDAPEVWVDVAWAEFAEAHGRLLERSDELLSPTAESLRYGAGLGDSARRAALGRVGEIRTWFEARMHDFELLIAPSTPFPAPRSDARSLEVRQGVRLDLNRGAISVLTRPVNLAGLPALSLPAGRSADGLPLGVQLIGRRGSESSLLRTASVVEAADARFCAGLPPGIGSAGL